MTSSLSAARPSRSGMALVSVLLGAITLAGCGSQQPDMKERADLCDKYCEPLSKAVDDKRCDGDDLTSAPCAGWVSATQSELDALAEATKAKDLSDRESESLSKALGHLRDFESNGCVAMGSAAGGGTIPLDCVSTVPQAKAEIVGLVTELQKDASTA
ncbi:hypothetical protein [Streptomyces sp. AA1529]|uniref:hypothetical protein n=1 Tax=Streptomyces sp. AA1529 TaxID=1203257 RepID=UPI00036C6DB5|nr:hypothetical protein [Streptomyces sp. AA1529]